MTGKTITFSLKNFIFSHKSLIILLVIFILHVFFRFYSLETKNIFGWDQVDNAWAAKDIIVDHKLPLLGMVAKVNSGINIGPAYYYLISIFYWMYDLDPIASAVFAGVTSVFTFSVFFYCIQKLFSMQVALISVFIHTVSSHVIFHDRIQWPVNFISPISLIIFFLLYQVATGKVKYLLPLAVAVGFSFHIHFTSVFYSIIILLTLPLFPRTFQTIKYSIYATLIFVIWLAPNMLAAIGKNSSQTQSLTAYISTYYHGVHGVRILQIAKDAFIEIESLLFFKILMPLKFLITPLFFAVYLYKKMDRNRIIMCYLIALWFGVPWFAFAVYSGEISNYYFFITRPITIFMLAYLSYRIFILKNILTKLAIVFFWMYYAYLNINVFLNGKNYNDSIERRKKNVKEIIQQGGAVNFQEGVPESYIFYIYTRNEKK